MKWTGWLALAILFLWFAFVIFLAVILRYELSESQFLVFGALSLLIGWTAGGVTADARHK